MADPTLEEVDSFVAEFKTLDGFLPAWRQDRGANWTARWGLLNAHGASEGELAFVINGRLTKPSISVLFRRKLIYRVDIVPHSVCLSIGTESSGLLGTYHKSKPMKFRSSSGAIRATGLEAIFGILDQCSTPVPKMGTNSHHGHPNCPEANSGFCWQVAAGLFGVPARVFLNWARPSLSV